MQHLDIRQGDTLAGAGIGDTVTNYYGETGVIVGQIGTTVWEILTASGRKAFVFKYDPSRVVVGV